MTSLILIALVLLIAVEAMQLIQNNLIQGRSINQLTEANARLEKKLKVRDDLISDLQLALRTELDKHDCAVVIAQTGTHFLPTGWRKKLLLDEEGKIEAAARAMSFHEHIQGGYVVTDKDVKRITKALKEEQ